MRMSAERTVAASRPVVWAALLDPDVLRQCIPGCTELTGSADEGFAATVVQKVGPVKATFRGKVTVSNRVGQESLTLTGEGKGGTAGFAKGSASVRLEEAGDSTRLHYDVDARVGGKLAQLGSRIIDGFVTRMAERFFERFAGTVTGNDSSAKMAEENEGAASKGGWLRRKISGKRPESTAELSKEG